MNQPATSRFVFIDALRGLSALAVVFFHAHSGGHLASLDPLLPAAVRGALAGGHAGVSVFFVISGFVIAHAMARDHVDLRYIGRFVARRAVRLDPAYWASIVLTLGIGVLSTQLIAGKAFVLPSWGVLLAHLTYVNCVLGMPIINDIYWTLCMEVQFYLTFSLLMWTVTRISVRVARERALDLCLWSATLFADLWPLGLAPFVGRMWFVQFWHLFLAGVLVWRACAGDGARRPLAVAVAALQTAMLVGLGLAHGDLGLTVGALASALVLAAGLADQLRRWLRWRALQALGALSYSLYLTHNTVTGALYRAGYLLLGRTPLTEALCFILVVLGCIAFAWVFYWTIERPSLALSRRIVLRGDSRVPSAPAQTSTPLAA